MKSIVVLMLSFGALLANARAADIDTLVAKQRELMLLKLENQIKDEQSKGGKPNASAAIPVPPPALPAGASAQGLGTALALPEFLLVGLYGIGQDLEAHIHFRDTVRPMKVGMSLAGWRLAAIEDRAVTLVSRRGNKTQQLYLNAAPVAIERSGVPALPMPHRQPPGGWYGTGQ